MVLSPSQSIIFVGFIVSLVYLLDPIAVSEKTDAIPTGSEPSSCETPTISQCEDRHEDCEEWADMGECEKNPGYMHKYCRESCLMCRSEVDEGEPPVDGSDFGVAQTIVDGKSMMIQKKIETSRRYLKTVKGLPKSILKECRNQHEDCTHWAIHGECEANGNYMKQQCAPACESCEYLTLEGRCPIDPDAYHAWKPGDLNLAFEHFTSLVEYSPETHSSPYHADGPWVVTMENVVTSEEAQHLIELGRLAGYGRSTEVGADGKHKKVRNKVSQRRTSTNAWCEDDCYEDEIAQRVMGRLSNITGIPEAHSEFLQLLKYEEGQFYKSHHDYADHHRRQQQGPRILTFYLYLNDVEQGGGTRFDQLNLTIHPKVGRAVLWPSVLNEDPVESDELTSHEALPVEKGVKYGANAWFHLRDFKTPFQEGCSS